MDHVIPKCTAAPTIIRRDSRRRFVVIDHEAIDDPNLTARALGFLAYLLGKPDNWETRTADLMKRFGCGKDYVYAALGELIAAGYAVRHQGRDEQGRMGRAELIIFETPQTSDCPDGDSCPDPALPEAVIPEQVNPPLLKNKEATKNEKSLRGTAAKPPLSRQEISNATSNGDGQVRPLLGYYVDQCRECGYEPLRSSIPHMVRQIGRLLAEKDEDLVRAALRVSADERKTPQALPLVLLDIEAGRNGHGKA